MDREVLVFQSREQLLELVGLDAFDDSGE
jgi:hypothetical protein